jgi:HK97 gp10 family phage protein
MKFDMEFRGIQQLEMTIYNSHKKAVEQANKVTKNNGELLKKKAQELAPRDTWFLHDNIVSKHFPLMAQVHSLASYSAYQEFGTRFMDAQPYMRPALEWVKPKYQKDMTDVMKGAFE